VFPTTVWDVVQAAGARDPGALEQFAREYRAPVIAFIQRRGVAVDIAEDLCHDVFLRVLTGGVLLKADVRRGTFRSLLCTVTVRVVQDWRRRQREAPGDDRDLAAPVPDFNRAWAVHLTERALRVLKRDSPRAYAVVRDHLAGHKQNRNKLWIARRKLISLVRREIALTCRSRDEVEREMAVLGPYLRPSSKVSRQRRKEPMRQKTLPSE
jgi:DNA-directed RNA polymerase specialized sigma24 family protein